MLKPQIGISYITGIRADAIEAFKNEVGREGLDIRTEERPHAGPFAGIEWLVPTAIVVFLGRSYFDAFLKEAGKDHYHLLKGALKKLSRKFVGQTAPKVNLVYSAGKCESATPKYSLLYSVMADLRGGVGVKLLLPPDCAPEECDAAVDAFMEFVDATYTDSLNQDSLRGEAKATPSSRTLLVAYNARDGILEVIDPIARRGSGPT